MEKSVLDGASRSMARLDSNDVPSAGAELTISHDTPVLGTALRHASSITPTLRASSQHGRKETASPLNPSLDHPASVTITSLGDLARAYQRRSNQVAQARYKNIALRTELQNQWSVWHHKRDFFRDSSKDFMTKLGSAKAEGTLKRSAARLNKLYARMQDDYDAVEEQAKKTLLLEAERSNHEIGLQALEKSQDNAVRALFTALDGNAWIGGETVIPETELEESPASSAVSDGADQQELHPALEHYYDCLGDVRMMLERLSGLDFSRTEDTILRGLRADQEIPLEQSDEDFDKMWQQEISAATVEYETALHHLKLALEACQALDITPPTPTRVSVAEDESAQQTPKKATYDAFSPPHSIPVWEVIAPAEEVQTPLTGPILDGEGVFPHPSPTESLRLTERIRSWISTVTETGTHPEQPANDSQSGPIRRKSTSDVFMLPSDESPTTLSRDIEASESATIKELGVRKPATAPPSPRRSKRAHSAIWPLPSSRTPLKPP